jgi:hypothetical protein
MHSTGSKKNAVQKSYATPLFLVNEKCTLITQVWQNLALPFALDGFRPRSRSQPGALQNQEKPVLRPLYGSEPPGLTGSFRVYTTFSFWISPFTQALAPQMLGLFG